MKSFRGYLFLNFLFFTTICFVSLFFYACMKTNPSPSLVNNVDGLGLPVTKGSYFKYIRNDTTSVRFLALNYYTDSSQEIITNMGKVIVPGLGITDSVYFLQINNITKNTQDTIYLLYNTETFSIFGRQVYLYKSNSYYSGPQDTIGNTNTTYNFTKWYNYLKLSLPVKNSPFLLDSLEGYPVMGLDTAFIRIDTTAAILKTIYSKSVYIKRDSYINSTAPSGAGGYTTSYNIIIKPNLGMIFTKQKPYFYQGQAGGGNNVFTDKWFTRKLIDYKIQ